MKLRSEYECTGSELGCWDMLGLDPSGCFSVARLDFDGFMEHQQGIYHVLKDVN